MKSNLKAPPGADAIEDQEVPRKLIADRWGEDVARIVEELTDDKKLPKDERKRKQVESAAHKSSKAKLIKLADATSNLRAITGESVAGLVSEASARIRLLGSQCRRRSTWHEHLA